MHIDLTYCDFLILAPLDIEIEALIGSLEASGWAPSEVPSTPDFPRIWEWVRSDPTSAHAIRRTVVVKLNHQGVLNASVDTARVLQLYEPGYVISFGIAGSLNPEDAPLGAVVFATGIIYYEPSKDHKNATKSRMDPVPVSEQLLNLFRNLSTHTPKMDGPLASGEKVVADIDSSDRTRILATNDKTLAVEMESAGVGRATRRLCHAAEFVALKGISDLADTKKGSIKKEIQEQHRRAAAHNAADCLVELIDKAPLRRHWRNEPLPYQRGFPQLAERETRAVLGALEPFGIRGDNDMIYRCLYGRRGPIPVYYHWKQKGKGLHWIDLKILFALRAMPRDIVAPVPIVSARKEFADGMWKQQVHGLLGVEPIEADSLREPQDELAAFFRTVGFTTQAEDDFRAWLQTFHKGRVDVYLNVMRYMVGQLNHRRMFVFTWNSMRTKWTPLSRAIGTAFAIFDWDTMCLDGVPGKQSEPGKSLTIEPGSYETLHNWLETGPAPHTVAEFVEHFKQLLEKADPQVEPMTALNELMLVWNKTLSVAV